MFQQMKWGSSHLVTQVQSGPAAPASSGNLADMQMPACPRPTNTESAFSQDLQEIRVHQKQCTK